MKHSIHHHLYESNPVIGLSFMLGYDRLAVMVGETIIFSLNNLIRGDVDSLIYANPPIFNPCLTGLRRQMGRGNEMVPSDNDVDSIYRLNLEQLEFDSYSTFNLNDKHQELGGDKKCLSTKKRIEVLVRNNPLAEDTRHYLTVEGLNRRLMADSLIKAMNPYARKLFLNSYSGSIDERSIHPVLTTLCKISSRIPQFKLTDLPGDRGLPVKITPIKAEILNRFTVKKAVEYLERRYHFTAYGLISK